jgi:replicative DNA helicase
MNDDTPPDYLSFGIKQLDRLLHVGRGKFLILGADSSAGKTALALQFAYHFAECGKKVCFFSLETDNDTLTDRLMAETQVADINLPRTKLKALTTADYQRATDAGIKSARVPLWLHDSAETVDEIRTWTVQEGFDVIVVDYLQLLSAEGEKRWDIVTNISMQLHRMAQKLGVTVLALSQVTPSQKGAKLTMDDLRESRQLKHDADVILILERCEDFANGRSLTIAKNKDGKRNQGMKLAFDPEHMTFSYYRRVAPSTAPGQQELRELDDEEGGENPFT